MDKALFTAMAKGADKAIKLMGAETEGSRAAASLFAEAVGTEYDLIMTGVQSVDDREGMMGPMLSSMLKIPCLSVVTRVEGGDSSITVHKEYFGGLMAAFDVKMPAVLGIQAARQTPRYAPVSKVRQIQESARSEEHTSELQSLVNLVCRLLLDQKQQKESASSSSPQYSFFRSLSFTRRTL